MVKRAARGAALTSRTTRIEILASRVFVPKNINYVPPLTVVPNSCIHARFVALSIYDIFDVAACYVLDRKRRPTTCNTPFPSKAASTSPTPLPGSVPTTASTPRSPTSR
jgi:hypothetical protein